MVSKSVIGTLHADCGSVKEMIDNGTYFDSIESWNSWMASRKGWQDDEPIMSRNLAEARLNEIADKILGEI